jgi:ribosome biogenesis protein ENP2
MHASAASRKAKETAANAKPEGVLAMRRATDGGMEMSYIPQSRGRGDDALTGDVEDEYSGGSFRHKDKVERFGAGLEKGGADDGDDDVEGDARTGRTKRRHIARSASKNAFRRN